MTVPVGGVILYDDTCGFCSRSVRWLTDHAPPDTFRPVGLDSDEGRDWLVHCGADPEDRSSVWHVEPGADGRCAHASTAFVRMVRHLRRPYRWLRVVWIVPRPLRDGVYRLVARNRHRL